MNEVVTFANVIIKTHYDDKYTSFNFKKNDKIYLRLHHDYKIFGEKNRKFHQQRVGFFSIFSKIDNLVYKLDLSSIMKI